MTKKYRVKDSNYEAVIHTESGPNKDRPVVFSYKSAGGQWWPDVSKPLNSPDCVVEEVPEEPIKVGYEFKHNGKMRKVVYQLAGKKPVYLVTSMDGDEEYHYCSSPADDLWDEDEIREAEAEASD